jgi:methylase of polypeptide subunit release factors
MTIPLQRAILPCLDHISHEDSAFIYIPAEDTYLLCDALLCEINNIVDIRKPGTVLEIGCGSGCVITYLCKLLYERNQIYAAYATDINPIALKTTSITAERNDVSVSPKPHLCTFLIADMFHY